MRIARLPSLPFVLFVLIAIQAFTLPRPVYAIKEENPQLAQLLEDADEEAMELANDADDTRNLIRSDENWVNHALMLDRVKGHVQNLALIIDKLTKAQNSGSELQKEAVEQMLPLVKELSTNTSAAINYLNQNKSRPLSDAYQQYLKKNAETARQLSSMISSLVDYERSMNEIQRLRSNLGVSTN
jgi:hypothetical protein